jgi:putative peptide zinc metalloprotease protein
LAIRFPGVNAEGLLARLAWLGKILFSRMFALAALVISLFAALLVFGRVDDFVRELPTLQSLAQPQTLGSFLVTMIAVKVFHELGHALACRRFGGECHEIGVMLLAFTPCLYCDVSDSWMFPRRWQRVVVALGGIYIELIIASLAALLWCFSEPGAVHTMALYIVLTCTVSTIFINGNPLLRYDGYYVLSDLSGIANLDEQARRALWEPVVRWITRRVDPAEPIDGGQPWLALYAAAAAVYRLLVLGIVLWFLHHVLVQNHLRPLADLLVAMVLCGFVFHTLRLLYRTIGQIPHWRLGGTMLRAAAVVGLLLGGGWLILNIRFEQRAEVAFQLEAAGAVPVFSPLAGRVVERLRYGQTVQQGELFAQLRDQELQLKLESLAGRVQETGTRLATMSIQAQQYPALFAKLATMRTEHADLRRQHATLSAEQQRLAVLAPVNGVVLRPLARYAGPHADTMELRQWSGAPLDGPNRNCYLKKGDLICFVGEPRRLQAVAQVDAANAGLISVGDQVRLRFDQYPGETVFGNVSEIGLSDLRTAARQAQNKKMVGITSAAFSDGFSPAQYNVRIELGRLPNWIRHGSGGIARIVTGHESVAQKIRRFSRRVFRFHL